MFKGEEWWSKQLVRYPFGDGCRITWSCVVWNAALAEPSRKNLHPGIPRRIRCSGCSEMGGTNVGFLGKKGFSLEPLYFCTLVCSPCFKLGDWSADLFNPKNGHPWIGQDMVFDSMGTPGGDSNPREPNQRSKFIAGLTLPAQRNQELVITNHYKSQRSSTIIHHHPTIILPSSYHHLRFVIA